MDSTQIDPDGAIALNATLNDGPPLPMFMLSEIRAREGGENSIIATTRGNVRLTANGSGTDDPDHENSMVLPTPIDPIQTPYPGITMNPRYE